MIQQQQHNHMKNTLMIVLCGVGILVSGCSKSHTSNSATLEGAWTGAQAGAGSQGMASLTVAGNSLELRLPNAGDWYKATFSLHEDTTPNQLEAVVTDCPHTNVIGKTLHGIYKFEGDKLTFAISRPDSPTPPPSFDANGAAQFSFTRKQ